jgi:F-type H+-transporting ATPase subunit b
MRMRLALAALALFGFVATSALAQHVEDADPHAVVGQHAESADAHHGDIDAHAGHDAQGGGDEAHGGHDAHINWATGFIGEKDGVEPGLLWRPVGTPPPLLANFINAGLLFYILYRFGKAPVAEGLKKRKARIVAGMEEAGKMKAEAEESLAKYEKKLEHIDQEIERVRREMREGAEAERERILADAKERQERMEREARVLVEQEMKAAREQLVRETVASAVRSAEEMLQTQIGPQDHDRLANEYVSLVEKSGVNATGGKA